MRNPKFLKIIIVSVCSLFLLSVVISFILKNTRNESQTASVIDEQVSIPENLNSSDSSKNEDSNGEQSNESKDKNIIGKWKWDYSTDARSNKITPKDSSLFVLEFGTDGRLNSSTDCNSLAGSYIKNEEVLSVGPLASTKMACEGETLESQYASEIALVSSYSITDNVLTLILIKDSGKMKFTRN